MAEAPEFTPAQARDLLMTLAGAVGDDVVKDILKSAVLAKAAAGNTMTSDRLTPDEVIRDLFMARERHVVPTPGTIQIGPTVGASGDGAEGMLREYSRFAPQPQALTKEYDKFSEEFGSLRSYLKSLQETTETGMAAMVKAIEALAKKEEEEVNVEVEEEEEESEKSSSFKALRTELLNTMISKAEEEEEEEKADDEEEEEEMGKSLSPAFRLTLAKATLRAAKDLCGRTDLPKAVRANVKTVVAKALRKARVLAKSTTEDKTLAKAAAEALRAVEEYMFLRGVQMKAKVVAKKEGMDKEGNQKKWPDEDAAKSFEAMVAGLERTKMDVASLMDTLSGKSRSMSVTETVEPLAKAMANPSFLAEKKTFVESQAKAKKLNDSEYGAAQEILSAMDMFKSGQISKDVPHSMIMGASRNVKDLFRDVMVEA